MTSTSFSYLQGYGSRRKKNRGPLPRPPQEFFVPSDRPAVPADMTPERFYLKHNLSMLELPDDWPLRQADIEVRQVKDDQIVVQPGDPDDKIIVVLEVGLRMCNFRPGKVVNIVKDHHQSFELSVPAHLFHMFGLFKAKITCFQGSLSVYISPCEGKTVMVKRIDPGHSFFSLLSLLDILMETPSKFKTVSVKANDESKIAL